MQRPEHFPRWRGFIGVAVFLCLALAGAGARASIAEMQQARRLQAPPAASHATPAAVDCMPCAGCYVAPAPSAHGCGGEGKEPDATGWQAQAAPSPRLRRSSETAGVRARVPVRIAFCRWLV